MLKPLKKTVSDCIDDLSSKDGYKLHKISQKLLKLKNYDKLIRIVERHGESIEFCMLGLIPDYCK